MCRYVVCGSSWWTGDAVGKPKLTKSGVKINERHIVMVSSPHAHEHINIHTNLYIQLRTYIYNFINTCKETQINTCTSANKHSFAYIYTLQHNHTKTTAHTNNKKHTQPHLKIHFHTLTQTLAHKTLDHTCKKYTHNHF